MDLFLVLFFLFPSLLAEFEGGEAEEGADDAGDPEADDDGVFGGVGGAAFGAGVCALEFFTGEDAATYLYRFDEPKELFLERLREATEAMGVHREIIYLPEEKIAEKPLYRMAVARSAAVRFLRARSDGRLIHSAAHDRRLAEFLGNCAP